MVRSTWVVVGNPVVGDSPVVGGSIGLEVARIVVVGYSSRSRQGGHMELEKGCRAQRLGGRAEGRKAGGRFAVGFR